MARLPCSVLSFFFVSPQIKDKKKNEKILDSIFSIASLPPDD
jgi:hypothetical protein